MGLERGDYSNDNLEKAFRYLQIHPDTFLIVDYWNEIFSFRCLFHALDETRGDDEDLPELKRGLLRAARKFRTYRHYINRQPFVVNSIFFGGKLTAAEQEELADALYSMAPNSEKLDRLSIEFMEELVTIQTEGDLPRLREVVKDYYPQFKKMLYPLYPERNQGDKAG